MSRTHILIGDVRERLAELADQSVHTIVTSPPYFNLRDYGIDGQIGLEDSPNDYIQTLVEVFREARRVLRDDGTLWLNLGDSYACSPPGNKTIGVSAKSTLHGVNNASGTYRETLAAGHATKRDTSKFAKQKDLLLIPAQVALALREDGWYLRSEIIWAKPSPLPESVRDRPSCAHEKVYLLSKSARYFYDADAVKEPSVMRPQNRFTKREEHPKGDDGRGAHMRPEGGTGEPLRNLRNVWYIAPRPFKGSHFATMAPEVAERCVKAGCPVSGTVLDPFGGTGTSALVANQHDRNAILVELHPGYVALAKTRLLDAGCLVTVWERHLNTPVPEFLVNYNSDLHRPLTRKS